MIELVQLGAVVEDTYLSVLSKCKSESWKGKTSRLAYHSLSQFNRLTDIICEFSLDELNGKLIKMMLFMARYQFLCAIEAMVIQGTSNKPPLARATLFSCNSPQYR